MGRRPVVPALLIAVFVAAGCGGPGPSSSPRPSPVPVTTVAAEPFSPAVDAARSAIASSLANAGFRLESPVQRYDPGQPGSLQTTPRAVYRINLIDPDQGWVVIYDVGSPDAAFQAGADFAAYLRTFGHSNYPADAEFALNVFGSALVFHWWSAQRSSEPDRAAAAFAAVVGVGQRIEVIN